MMKAGFACRRITPENSVPLAGFDLRKDLSKGVHDNLLVSVLSLWADQRRAFLFSFDLLGVPDYFCEKLEEKLRARFGACCAQVSAVHTHGAPQSIFRSFSCYQESYEDFVLEQGLLAAENAVLTEAEGTLSWKRIFIENVGSKREEKREEAQFSMPVELGFFSPKDGKADPSLIVRLACHPTVLDEKNLLLTADLVWGARQSLSEFGKRTVFLNGACGDISTRFTRKESGFEEALRLGTVLGTEIRDALAEGAFCEGKEVLACARETIKLPPADVFSPEERQAVLLYLEERLKEEKDGAAARELQAVRSVLLRKSYGAVKGAEVTLQVLRVGDRLLLACPFEIRAEEGRKIEEAVRESSGLSGVFCGYSEGYEGYLPSGRPLSKDSSYEDVAARYGGSSGKLLRETFQRLALRCVEEGER